MTKKPGGQPRNKNALKHGIFARRIAVIQNVAELDKMPVDKNTAELAHARALLADGSDLRHAAVDDEAKIRWDYACRHWTEIVDNMIFRNVNKTETEVMIFESLLEAIRYSNDKQNVKK